MRLIDADALVALVQDSTILGDGFKYAFVALVKGEPTVDAEPVRHGEWIFKERKGIKEAWYQCSECNAYDLREIDVTSHYCWACGAKMDGERKDDENA